ncbi:MAG: PDZ domain-containing protein [Betaproteobacteria bacterium]
MTPPPIRYAIRPSHPAAHRFEVCCTVDHPAASGQRFALPAWIPGSYLIRDFARNVISIRAECGGKTIRIRKIDKNTWQADALKPAAPLTLTYEVYAWDLSVRGAHLDETHAFFNGTSVFLRVLGQEDSPCLVELLPPQGKVFKDWRIATALEPARAGKKGAARHGFGLYQAENYDELIDHPVEMGCFTLAHFDACGAPHDIAITGRHDADLERLTADLKRICETQIRFFGEPAPMSRYTFLVTAVGDGYGGLEHRASTALLCSRNDLPYRGMGGISEGYQTFLGLCSHEYFHTWNVKRIKPAAFTPYDLERENYTSLLWAFEGFTSYYDDLLLRSGIIQLEDWLKLMAKTICNVHRAPGRLHQSLAESSFDAWSKFYRPDENTPNAVVSYYAKGALLALGLDLTLRAKTGGKVSLDTVMLALWERFGKTGTGVGEDDIRRIAEELSGLSLRRFFADYVDGTAELPLKKWLAPFGIMIEWEKARVPSLGVKTSNEGSEVNLATVYDGGAAQKAGLSAGDMLLAIGGLRVSASTLDKHLARCQDEDTIRVHAFRRDELMEFTVCLDPAPSDTARLSLGKQKNSLLRGWLRG